MAAGSDCFCAAFELQSNDERFADPRSALPPGMRWGITVLTMDGEFLRGMIIVAVVFAGMTVLVLVSRARIERFHRHGAPSLRPRIRRDRHG